MTLPTNITRGGLGAAGLAVVGVLLAWLVWGGAMFSPGGLSAKSDSTKVLGGVTSHAALGGRCTACHAAATGGRPMSDRCLACHTDTQVDLRDSTTLHGAIDNARACLACHTEHGGPAGSLVKAGVGAGDHARFGFALDAHRRTDGGAAFRCADCHSSGTYRFDRARCEACHRDYQPKFVVAHVREWGSDCMACHDGIDRFSRGRFSHDTVAFRLLGAHQTATCVACHVDVRALAGFGTASSECVSCHGKDDDHKGRFGANCGSCHTVTAWTPATFDHKVSTDCVSCHRKDDEHRGEFGTDCAACHGVTAWKPATLEHAFPLDHGEGGRVACKVCHQPGRPYREYTCYGCHEHTVSRIQRKHQEEGISGARLDDCVRCHATGREHEGGEGGGGDGDGD